MKPLSKGERGSPEELLSDLSSRIGKHALWDVLLVLLPPAFALSYILFFLYRLGLISSHTVTALTALAAASFGVLGWRSFSAPAVSSAARLIDGKVAAQDHFLTLATLDRGRALPSLVSRLRREAAAFMHRLDLRKDFPYQVKRSFFVSATASLGAILLFHAFLAIGFSAGAAPELGRVARRLSERPGFSELARDLVALAVGAGGKSASREEQSRIEGALAKVEEGLRSEVGGGAGELLGEAARILRGLRAGGSGEGRGEGEGGKRSEMVGASSSRAESQKKGEEGQGDARGKQERGGVEKQKGGAGAGSGPEMAEKGGTKMEGIPRGPEPERFLRPGEKAEKGIKGARFVRVELPEEGTEGLSGERAGGRGGKLMPKGPTSNLPLKLRANRDAPPEKQPMPLEYRELIR